MSSNTGVVKAVRKQLVNELQVELDKSRQLIASFDY